MPAIHISEEGRKELLAVANREGMQWLVKLLERECPVRKGLPRKHWAGYKDA
jgi:hypothetical protein